MEALQPGAAVVVCFGIESKEHRHRSPLIIDSALTGSGWFTSHLPGPHLQKMAAEVSKESPERFIKQISPSYSVSHTWMAPLPSEFSVHLTGSFSSECLNSTLG